jgi:D-lyxose ketol-isomerase
MEDDEGMEFTSFHDAKCQAVHYMGRHLCDAGEKFWDSADFKLTATDENGLILFTINIIGTEAPAVRKAAQAK